MFQFLSLVTIILLKIYWNIALETDKGVYHFNSLLQLSEIIMYMWQNMVYIKGHIYR